MGQVKRITVSLDAELVKDIDYLHKRLGLSRSAMLNEMLSRGIRDLAEIVREMSSEMQDDGLKRLRGKSAVKVAQRMEELQQMLEGESNAH